MLYRIRKLHYSHVRSPQPSRRQTKIDTAKKSAAMRRLNRVSENSAASAVAVEKELTTADLSRT